MLKNFDKLLHEISSRLQELLIKNKLFYLNLNCSLKINRLLELLITRRPTLMSSKLLQVIKSYQPSLQKMTSFVVYTKIFTL